MKRRGFLKALGFLGVAPAVPVATAKPDVTGKSIQAALETPVTRGSIAINRATGGIEYRTDLPPGSFVALEVVGKPVNMGELVALVGTDKCQLATGTSLELENSPIWIARNNGVRGDVIPVQVSGVVRVQTAGSDEYDEIHRFHGYTADLSETALEDAIIILNREAQIPHAATYQVLVHSTQLFHARRWIRQLNQTADRFNMAVPRFDVQPFPLHVNAPIDAWAVVAPRHNGKSIAFYCGGCDAAGSDIPAGIKIKRT